MKLWEIKAQALRLMFADSDIQFSENEFQTQTIYTNANTREKLIRMEDSIKRAIDLYHQYNGEETRVVYKTLDSATVNNVLTYYNTITVTSSPSDFGLPSRIDVVENLDYNITELINIAFDFEEPQVTENAGVFTYPKIIKFLDYDFTPYKSSNGVTVVSFRIYYKAKKQNIIFGQNQTEMNYDLNILNIPEEVQRQIPLYVKGELYQEDEPNMAQQSKQEYIQFLILNQRKQFVKGASKVRRAFKRNHDV
jgi:hypothetical protein